MVGTVFLWAAEFRVRWAWSYEWWAPEATVLALPATENNTVVPADAGDEYVTVVPAEG